MAERFTLTDSQASDLVRSRVDPGGVDSHRRPWELQWIRNIAYLNGKHHFISDGHRLRNPVLPPHKVRYRANLIRSSVTRAIESVMATQATFKSPPSANTKRARDASFVSEKLFDHARKILKWNAVMEQMLHWSAALGSGILHIFWDPEQGEPDRYYLEDLRSKRTIIGLTPEEMREKEEQGLFEDRPPGEIAAMALNLFEFHWDFRAREEGLAGARWAARKRLVDIPVLEDQYGFAKTKNIKPIDIDGESTYFEELIAFMASGFQSPLTSYAVPKDKQREQTIVTELYEIPMRRNRRQGRKLVVAGDTVVLENMHNPYRRTHAPLPYIDFPWQIRPGAFVGHSLVEMLISPQFHYNLARAKIIEHQNVYGAPTIFVPKGSGLRTGDFATQPGLIREYTPVPGVAKPFETGPIPTLSKEVAQNAQMALSEMNYLSSQADPDLTKLPGQIRGGPAMELMLEEKNKVLKPTARRFVDLTEESGRRMLRLMRDNYEGRRVLAYAGEDNQYRVVEFNASDINTDLHIVGEPAYFFSSATQRAKVLEMVQVGALDPQNPRDKVDILKGMAFSTPDELIADRLADEDCQEAEIQEVLANPLNFVVMGEGSVKSTLEINPWDDDEAHMKVLERRFKRRAEWNSLPELPKMILLNHYMMHRSRYEQRIQAALEQQAALKGTPGQKGRASQPAAV